MIKSRNSPYFGGKINVAVYTKDTFVWKRRNENFKIMMTSSNGNIFRVTGPLCGEFTGHQWIPLTKASEAELWCRFQLHTAMLTTGVVYCGCAVKCDWGTRLSRWISGFFIHGITTTKYLMKMAIWKPARNQLTKEATWILVLLASFKFTPLWQNLALSNENRESSLCQLCLHQWLSQPSSGDKVGIMTMLVFSGNHAQAYPMGTKSQEKTSTLVLDCVDKLTVSQWTAR